ncbi:hypothetical protein ABZ606_10445 [Streptomyces sp. NPDC012461]|uniref:Lipoprotein n=3 Tax=unclassified Streptomyces TaxID=2593676 RepID=A0A6G3R2J8_9ACTN|nr:hypothetical protein [Streptomyces sp. SID14436]MBM7090718.1 hypothetical protein [Streptomyces sp. S12]NEA89825.1 hypothetical protein [Streptomyces sp. SID14436]
MHAIRVASAALLSAGALALAAAPVAVAGDVTPFGFDVEPEIVDPGDTVTLRVDRAGGGCKGHAKVSSPVFDTVTIPPKKSKATAVVDWDARPGAVYQVAFTCDGVTGTAPLTIASDRPVPLPTPVPVQPEHPKGVHAGEGGSFAGLDAGRLGLGALIVAGALGAAYRHYRRPSPEDGA